MRTIGLMEDKLSTSSSNIVVIEDAEDIRDVIVYNLQRDGYVVPAAGNGEDGLSLISDQAPVPVSITTR